MKGSRGLRRGRTAAALLALIAGVGTALAAPTSALAAAPLDGLPAYQHVVVLLEENQSIDSTYGPGSPATYLKNLVKTGTFADHYYGTGHLSLDNYIALLSGQKSSGVTNGDCFALNLFACAQVQSAQLTGRNLADQLDDAGVSWKGYMDGNTLPCQHADYSPTASQDTWQGNGSTPAVAGKDFADRHNPFLYFPDIVGNAARCTAHVRPYTELPHDLAANQLPRYSFITPDTCHDGHDTPCSGGGPGGVKSIDAWLKTEAPPLLAYLGSHRGLLIITTDEGAQSDTRNCCNPGTFGGVVGLVAVGPGVKVGQTVATPYNHNSLLHTMESLFGISENLNNAAGTVAMTDLFQAGYVFPASAGPGEPAAAAPAAGTATGSGLPGTGTPPVLPLAAGTLVLIAVALSAVMVHPHVARLRPRR